MRSPPPITRRRGRPSKDEGDVYTETREALIRSGLAALTEKNFSAVGLDEMLRSVNVSKGSFYHYFDSKEAFGSELIERYAAYFANKLDRFLLNRERAPLQRMRDFMENAEAGMARHAFRRGCLVGNLGQEMSALPESYRTQLVAVFADWEARVRTCLLEAQARGDIGASADCAQLATFFWIGWEGAVLRAKLEQGPLALHIFAAGFFAALRP
jgi:TetR/AcrR family transcriptional regulator, transcriptional repressor for nem operon